MVFGVVSNSPQQATRWLFLSLLWLQPLTPILLLAAVLAGPFLGASLSAAIIVALLAVLLKWTHRWAPWRMSLVLALSMTLLSTVSAFVAPLLDWGGRDAWAFVLLAGFGLLAGFTYFWWRLGLHVFEEGMSGESASSSRALRA
jgi:hypothetical protein